MSSLALINIRLTLTYLLWNYELELGTEVLGGKHQEHIWTPDRHPLSVKVKLKT